MHYIAPLNRSIYIPSLHSVYVPHLHLSSFPLSSMVSIDALHLSGSLLTHTPPLSPLQAARVIETRGNVIGQPADSISRKDNSSEAQGAISLSISLEN